MAVKKKVKPKVEVMVTLAPCACGCGTPVPVRKTNTKFGPAGSATYARNHYPSNRAARPHYPSTANRTNIYLDADCRDYATQLMKREGISTLSALIRFYLKKHASKLS